MPKDKLLSALKAPESAKNLDKIRIENIREELKKLAHKFSKSEIKEIRKSLYEIENKKDLTASREKEIKKNPLELEEKLFQLKKYYDKDEYGGMRSTINLLDLTVDEDYYKPIITKLLIVTIFIMKVWGVKTKTNIYPSKNILIGLNHI